MKLLAFFSIVVPLILWGQSDTYLDESFDPTTLHDWPNSKAKIENIKSLNDFYAGLSDQADTVEVAEYLDFVFRVQLGSTNDYDVAIALEERAVETFEDEIIIQFDSPYYKIRVGKMKNREDAQNLQQFAINNGYRRAWVIRTENTPSSEN